MHRSVIAILVVAFAAVASTPSSAERARRQAPQPGNYQATQQEHDACSPDARRLCRRAGDDQNAVLSCLQLNKFKLRKPCRELLQRYGMI
jgi:hypothetical protein